MISLLRNCSHGSEVATYVVDAGQARTFVKVALTPEGREALDSEAAGWAWYQSRRAPDRAAPICRMVRRDAHVARVEIDGIAGVPGRAADGIGANRPLIAAAIGQYCDVWTPDEAGRAPLHGDLSCDNLITGLGGLWIIDWEHFHPAGAPWGFDAVYLLCESLYFQRLRAGAAGDDDAPLAAAQMKRLADTHPLPAEMLSAPFAFTRNFIRANAQLWRGELARHPLKLPILSLAEEDVTTIDASIRDAFNRSS